MTLKLRNRLIRHRRKPNENANSPIYNWTFVEQAELTDQHVEFRFNEATRTPGPFAARVRIAVRSATGSRRYRWKAAEFAARCAASSSQQHRQPDRLLNQSLPGRPYRVRGPTRSRRPTVVATSIQLRRDATWTSNG